MKDITGLLCGHCRSSLRKHLLKHTGMNKKPCKICGKRYSALGQHYLMMHSGRKKVKMLCPPQYKSN